MTRITYLKDNGPRTFREAQLQECQDKELETVFQQTMEQAGWNGPYLTSLTGINLEVIKD